MRTHGSGRATGIPLGFEATNVYDLVDSQITRVRIFLDAIDRAIGLMPSESRAHSYSWLDADDAYEPALAKETHERSCEAWVVG